MKASDSGRSELRHGAVYAVAGAWLLAHVPFLSPALEDIDSINFALGLHHYEPALHQPHPPGYPVFIAAGRLALAIIHVVAPTLSYVRADALALAIWSAVGGAIGIVAAVHVFFELTAGDERAPTVAFWGAMLMAVTPLFWMTGLRPMSDMFGLGVALASQALLLRGARDGRGLVAGALLAGLAAGIRTQTVPLTFPLFLYAVGRASRSRPGITLMIRPLAALIVGGLAWGIPLLVLTGGVDGYVRALGSQAGEDFAWVDMLWAHPTPRAIAFALFDTFVLPFQGVVIAVVMLALAAAGKLWLLVKDRRALLLLTLAYAPYVFFHLLFQEAANLRYATPLVPPIAYLVARALSLVPGPRGSLVPARCVATALTIWLVVLVVRPTVTYGREPHPAFRAIADMTAASAGAKPAAVFSHYSLRRPLQAQPTTLPVVEPVRNYEWLGLEKYWLSGGTQPVWFLADPKRTDLALIDPQLRRDPLRYSWSVATLAAFSGTRPIGVDWYRFEPPTWFAGEGWELTPETAGIARSSNTRLQRRPIVAHVRRRTEPIVAIVAGRDLGPPNDPPSLIDVAVDGKVVETLRIDPAKDGIDFFHVLQLPAGMPSGTGNYATLTLSARAEQPGVPTPSVAVEQFDIQPVGTVMFGFGEGWQEAEYNNSTGLAWRWTSDRSALRIMPARDIRIRLRGESPLKYFDSPPSVRIRAGARELAVFHPDRDFSWEIPVSGDALTASGGIVTIETDKVYRPGQAEGTADQRRLGLRIFETRVDPGLR